MTEQERIMELANEISEKVFTPDWENSPERTVQALLVIAIMMTTETWRKVQPEITEDHATGLSWLLHNVFNLVLNRAAQQAGVPMEVVKMNDQVEK